MIVISKKRVQTERVLRRMFSRAQFPRLERVHFFARNGEELQGLITAFAVQEVKKIRLSGLFLPLGERQGHGLSCQAIAGDASGCEPALGAKQLSRVWHAGRPSCRRFSLFAAASTGRYDLCVLWVLSVCLR